MTNAKRDAEDENKWASAATKRLRHFTRICEKLVQCSMAYHVRAVEEAAEIRELEKKLDSIGEKIANCYNPWVQRSTRDPKRQHRLILLC